MSACDDISAALDRELSRGGALEHALAETRPGDDRLDEIVSQAARQLVPKLMARVDELEAENAALRNRLHAKLLAERASLLTEMARVGEPFGAEINPDHLGEN